VLENASGAIRALTWMFQEILTNRCEVLSAECLFLLQFFLSMCESASLLFELVLTLIRRTAEEKDTQQIIPHIGL
jgi:hypothetical protein